jgi:hypothetical protein
MSHRLATFFLATALAATAGLATAVPASAGETCGVLSCCTDENVCQCHEVTVNGHQYARPCVMSAESVLTHGGG